MSNGPHDLHDPPVCVDDSAYQDRIFAECGVERQRIIDALLDSQSGEGWRIANKLSGCCRAPMILCDREETTLRLSERRCRSRCCPRCRRFRSREIQHRLIAACTKMDARRFLTLTLKSEDSPLRDQLKHLRKAFARLRRHRFWRSRVTGGVYCVEVTYNHDRRQWHPHLHAIIDGEYVPKGQLSDAWAEASEGSYIVDIRRVNSASSVASYIAKYVGKSDDASLLPDAVLLEWATSVHGLRLVHSFGNLHGVDLVEKPESVPGISVEVCNPSTLASASQRGDQVAASILAAVEASAAGRPLEDDHDTLARIHAWQTWVRLEELAHPPPIPEQPPPLQPMLWNG